jgi:hypothetical protein
MLNPINAFVADAASAVILLVGSRETRKWNFTKRTMLPFVANELFANIAQMDQKLNGGGTNSYQAQISFSSFEIQVRILDTIRALSDCVRYTLYRIYLASVIMITRECISDIIIIISDCVYTCSARVLYY